MYDVGPRVGQRMGWGQCEVAVSKGRVGWGTTRWLGHVVSHESHESSLS